MGTDFGKGEKGRVLIPFACERVAFGASPLANCFFLNHHQTPVIQSRKTPKNEFFGKIYIKNPISDIYCKIATHNTLQSCLACEADHFYAKISSNRNFFSKSKIIYDAT